MQKLANVRHSYRRGEISWRAAFNMLCHLGMHPTDAVDYLNR